MRVRVEPVEMYELEFSKMPRIMAMVFKNENIHVSSEKEISDEELDLIGLEAEYYEKWKEIFRKLLKEEESRLDDVILDKIVEENARNFISVFTPSVNMTYTVDLLEVNCFTSWARNMVNADVKDDHFMELLQPHMKKLTKIFSEEMGARIVSENNGEGFSFFANKHCKSSEYEGRYSLNFSCSFLQLAQSQKNRSLRYEIEVPLEKKEYYVPEIIRCIPSLKNEYLKDIKWINFPQAMLVNVNQKLPL